MKKQNVRTISLIVCTFTYLLVGAAVFDALESETEKKRWDALNAIENMIARKYCISEEDFKVIETVVLKSEPHKAGQQWKFTGAFYYATTVLTTIGYGHSTPSTIGGKLFTMCYAIVGIPLGLVMFQSIGERVNRLSSFVIKTVKSSLNCRKTAASEVDLICVVTTLSSLTIAGGAAAFSKFEGWNYFDSVYYCFITLTTIGFGDMVALQKDNALNKKPEYVMFALVFILFGLAIVAASLNLLVLRFVTMNTEDERRDEAQAIQTRQLAVRLEGDVITANGSVYSGNIGHNLSSLNGDNTSTCSCHCACFRTSEQKGVRRRSPSQIKQQLLTLSSQLHTHPSTPTLLTTPPVQLLQSPCSPQRLSSVLTSSSIISLSMLKQSCHYSLKDLPNTFGNTKSQQMLTLQKQDAKQQTDQTAEQHKDVQNNVQQTEQQREEEQNPQKQEQPEQEETQKYNKYHLLNVKQKNIESSSLLEPYQFYVNDIIHDINNITIGHNDAVKLNYNTHRNYQLKHQCDEICSKYQNIQQQQKKQYQEKLKYHQQKSDEQQQQQQHKYIRNYANNDKNVHNQCAVISELNNNKKCLKDDLELTDIPTLYQLNHRSSV